MITRLLACVFLIMAGVWVCLPILLSPHGWSSLFDAVRIPFLLQQFADEFVRGSWYPRWLSANGGGYGHPVFVFYQPGLFYFLLPLQLALNNPLLASQIGMVALVLLGIGGAYFLARLFLPVGYSVLCALTYITSPYVSVILFRRPTLSELLSGVVALWVTYVLMRIMRSRVAPGFGVLILFTVLLAAAIVTHPITTYFFLPYLVAFLLYLRWRPGLPDAQFYSLLLAVLGAVALSSPYWLHPLLLKEYVGYERVIIGGFNPLNQLLWPGDIFDFNPFTVPNSYTTDVISPYYFALACLGCWLARSSPLARFNLYALIAGIVLCLPLAAPFWWATRFITAYVQFPWRLCTMLLIPQLFGIICLCIYAPRLNLLQRQVVAAAACVAIFIIAGSNFRLLLPVAHLARVQEMVLSTWPFNTRYVPSAPLDVATRDGYYKEMENVARGTNSPAPSYFWTGDDNALKPKSARWRLLAPRSVTGAPLVEVVGGNMRILSQSFAGAEASVEVAPSTTPGAAMLMINQFYFPGWRLQVNNQDLEFSPPGEEHAGERGVLWQQERAGRSLLTFPQAGNYAVKAWYDGPPGWQLRNVAIAIITLLVLCAWRYTVRMSMWPKTRGGEIDY